MQTLLLEQQRLFHYNSAKLTLIMGGASSRKLAEGDHDEGSQKHINMCYHQEPRWCNGLGIRPGWCRFQSPLSHEASWVTGLKSLSAPHTSQGFCESKNWRGTMHTSMSHKRPPQKNGIGWIFACFVHNLMTWLQGLFCWTILQWMEICQISIERQPELLPQSTLSLLTDNYTY